MECPKCHKNIPDNSNVCPHCHKVLTLVCPNCHSFSQSSVCSKCGYIILEKCSKCGRLTPTVNKICKCGLEINKSIAYNECETDEFASVTINFGALNAIRNSLESKELYTKFVIKLKNIINSQIKDVEGNVILYGDNYVINFNKELSFPTSVNKAVRHSIKILNAFAGLNLQVQDELGLPLNITLTILKKNADELLKNRLLKTKVKQFLINKTEQKYLKGMQVMMDQFCQDAIHNEYKTDSLFLVEQEGQPIMFYELKIDNYISTPSSNREEIININQKTDNNFADNTQDIYSFKTFDLNAKCRFEKYFADNLFVNLDIEQKILTLKGDKDLQISTNDLIKFYKNNNHNVLYVSCTEELTNRPWGVMLEIFMQYYILSEVRKLNDFNFDYKILNPIKALLMGNAAKVASPEDARYKYMELFGKLLSSMRNYTIIIDGVENIDSTSLQTIELYFDNFKRVNTNFVFITNDDNSLHTKIKGLISAPIYTEITLLKSSIGTLLSDIKEEAEDFIQSPYYEKIKANFNGSKLYFDNVMKYLTEKGALVSIDNKLIIKNNSVELPADLTSIIRARLKLLGKNKDASMILASSLFIGARLDFKLLEKLGIQNVQENAKMLETAGFVHIKYDAVYINNFSLINPIIKKSLKREVQEFVAKSLVAKLGKDIDESLLALLMGGISMYKEQYLLLWKISQFAIQTGDYDAYLKNCLDSLKLIDKIESVINKQAVEENKKEVYENILFNLYGYSPEKVYSIAKILHTDALKEKDDDKIIRLSNLMLQGALLASNYTNAPGLLNHIFKRIRPKQLIVDGAINIRYLLLLPVKIEVLFNVGDYRGCIEAGEQLLEVLKPELIDKIKPASFSSNIFITHLMEIFRLTGFAKMITNDKDFDIFAEKVKTTLNMELPEKDCINAIKDFLADKGYSSSNTEEASSFAKIVYLILRELSETNIDYKTFAQNIYQAKLLAADIHQIQLEYICDLLIGYAYSKAGIYKKAAVIFDDVYTKSKQKSIFNTKLLAKYFIIKQKLALREEDKALEMINSVLEELSKQDNQAVIFYALFKKLYIEAAAKTTQTFDIRSEEQMLADIAPNGELEKIIKRKDSVIKPLEYADDENNKQDDYEYHTAAKDSDILKNTDEE